MRLFNIKSIVVLLALVMSVASCTKDLAELNIDPTASGPDQFDPNFLLTTSQLRYTGSSDFSYDTWRAQLIYCSTMIQHFSTTQGYWAGDKYMQNDAYLSAYFERAYEEQVKHVVDMVELTRDNPDYANLHQIARIWKVVVFQRLTDLYGDIPYSEAGKGYYDRVFKPKYDTQEFIYNDMLTELESAMNSLSASNELITGDMIYQGDIDSWKRFAASMMLRLGMRLSKVDAAAAKTWVEKADAAGTFTGIADNARVLHDEANGRATINRISQVMNLPYELPVLKWSEAFMSRMSATDDPRIPVLAELPPPGSNSIPGVEGDNTPANQLGMPNGYDLSNDAEPAYDIANAPGYPGAVGDDKVGNYSRPRNTILAQNGGPTFIITYAETELLLAEAAKNGWSVGGTAQSHYDAGVTGAMNALAQFSPNGAIDAADITTYLTNNPYVDGNGYEMIGEQYWFATILNDYEAYSNWRRTGFPTLTEVSYPGNATAGSIPRKFPLPDAEASVNGDNYAAAVANMGGNELTTRVWWDKE